MSDPPLSGKRIIFVANTDWHLFNFRLPIAHEARRRGAEVLLVSPPGPYVERLRDTGFEHVAVALRQRGMNPLRDVAFAGRLRRLYRRTRPDMVHHFSVKPVIYGSLAARYRGGPVVVNAVPGLGYAFAGGGGMKRLLVRGVVSALYGSSLRGEGVWTIFQNEEDRELFLRRDWISMTRAYMIAGSGSGQRDASARSRRQESRNPRSCLSGGCCGTRGWETSWRHFGTCERPGTRCAAGWPARCSPITRPRSPRPFSGLGRQMASWRF